MFRLVCQRGALGLFNHQNISSIVVATTTRCFTTTISNSNGASLIKGPPYNILFFGTDNVSIHTLKALNENKKNKGDLVNELQVVCPKSDKKEEVETYSMNEGLAIHYPHPDTGMKQFQVPLTETNKTEFDLAIVVSFGYFIPKSVLSKFKYGGINMHPSLLPRHRGAAPMYHTILENDDTTGISVIELHPQRFDAGNILMQVKDNQYRKDKLYLQVLNELAELGSKSIMETLREFPKLSSEAKPQGEQGKTLAPKVNRQMSKIDCTNSTRKDLWILYRAFSDNISLHCMIYNKKYKTNKRIKVRGMITPYQIDPLLEFADTENQSIYQSLESDLQSYQTRFPQSELSPGTYFLETDKSKSYHNIMWLKCKDGWVGVTKIFEEGKKNPVKASEFLFGKNIISINDPSTPIPYTQIIT
ncbi:hypothetical protein CYY_003401 [Polysphondylium violaceum]|uniref:methionyl-tRNA formyltransferase n=1 Tax=Polysphondylium violaceum TaxID=133409 RepID=A0A8J4V5X7_9MYCE|nr:hypothetical protein CYY_003401 [Polysphondylium violaceum]